MKIDMDGIEVENNYTGLLFKSETPLYILANRDNFDFVYSQEFDNHYLNNPNIDVFSRQEDGICVISTIEIIDSKFFTNISLLLDVELDSYTVINLFKTCVECITNVSSDVGAVNDDELYDDFGNYYNTIFVASRGKLERRLAFDISLYYQVKELVDDVLYQSFSHIGYK